LKVAGCLRTTTNIRRMALNQWVLCFLASFLQILISTIEGIFCHKFPGFRKKRHQISTVERGSKIWKISFKQNIYIYIYGSFCPFSTYSKEKWTTSSLRCSLLLLQLKPQTKPQHMLFVCPHASTEISYSPWPALHFPTIPTLDGTFLNSAMWTLHSPMHNTENCRPSVITENPPMPDSPVSLPLWTLKITCLVLWSSDAD
jgi:hypothetical protein